MFLINYCGGKYSTDMHMFRSWATHRNSRVWAVQLPLLIYSFKIVVTAVWALQWRHNGRDSVSNHHPREYILNRLIRCRSKKTSKLRLTGLCAGNSPETGEFPAQRASNAENGLVIRGIGNFREVSILSVVRNSYNWFVSLCYFFYIYYLFLLFC